jgi:hypothetical protein
MLFAGMLYSRKEYYHAALDKLKGIFGPIVFETPERPWESTNNHYGELGTPIKRRFVFFEKLIAQNEIAGIKLSTNEIEGELSEDGKRRVNIDPGYLTLAKVVLATTKDYSHRLYLGKGIFAEVSLIFKNDTYQSHLFTYRDYEEPESIGLFNDMREVLKGMLKGKQDS